MYSLVGTYNIHVQNNERVVKLGCGYGKGCHKHRMCTIGLNGVEHDIDTTSLSSIYHLYSFDVVFSAVVTKIIFWGIRFTFSVFSLGINIKTGFFCQLTRAWDLHVVAYILHTGHAYFLTHTVNLCIQSLKYHKTPSLKKLYVN